MRHLTAQQLSASVDQALYGVSLELVRRHLSACDECTKRREARVRTDEALRRLLFCDPGDEYFEDAATQLETELENEVMGRATAPRTSKLAASILKFAQPSKSANVRRAGAERASGAERARSAEPSATHPAEAVGLPEAIESPSRSGEPDSSARGEAPPRQKPLSAQLDEPAGEAAADPEAAPSRGRANASAAPPNARDSDRPAISKPVEVPQFLASPLPAPKSRAGASRATERTPVAKPAPSAAKAPAASSTPAASNAPAAKPASESTPAPKATPWRAASAPPSPLAMPTQALSPHAFRQPIAPSSPAEPAPASPAPRSPEIARDERPGIAPSARSAPVRPSRGASASRRIERPMGPPRRPGPNSKPLALATVALAMFAFGLWIGPRFSSWMLGGPDGLVPGTRLASGTSAPAGDRSVAASGTPSTPSAAPADSTPLSSASDSLPAASSTPASSEPAPSAEGTAPQLPPAAASLASRREASRTTSSPRGAAAAGRSEPPAREVRREPTARATGGDGASRSGSSPGAASPSRSVSAPPNPPRRDPAPSEPSASGTASASEPQRPSSSAATPKDSAAARAGRASAEPETPASAESARWPLVCGEILDESGMPIAGARAFLADLDLAARSDRNGRFCIAAPPGDRTISVVAQGFASYRSILSVERTDVQLRITLKAAP